MLSLSVVVPTRNRPDQLDACLAALLAATRPGDEVIVSDSASATGAAAEVASRHGVRYVREEVKGASRARNAGWHAASNDLVAFIDDDVTVLEGWAEAIAAPFSRADVAFVTGSISLPPGDEGGGPVPMMLDDVGKALTPRTQGALGASANLAVRREHLDATGGFDERIGPGTWFEAAEDVALFDALLRRGLEGWYEPSAKVHHPQWRSRREQMRLEWGYGKGMGARLALLFAHDRSRARREARALLVTLGVLGVLRHLRTGYNRGALGDLLRTVATIVAVPRAALSLRGEWSGRL